jgi:opacity protein-like surface antigen
MQRNIRSRVLVASCCLGLFASPCTGRSQNFYFDADAGVSLADDVKLRRFINPTPGGKLKLDVDPRLSVAGGYNFNEYIGAQLETGLIANEVKNLGGNGDASLSHVPMLADVVIRCDRPNCNWVPYAGIGAGGDVSVITLDHVRGPSGGAVDGTGSTVVFAWQAFAGARYKLNDRMSIGGGYKFFSASGATWDVEHTSGDIKAGTAQIHSFGVNFNLKF